VFVVVVVVVFLPSLIIPCLEVLLSWFAGQNCTAAVCRSQGAGGG
jgi:hypothetical protein